MYMYVHGWTYNHIRAEELADGTRDRVTLGDQTKFIQDTDRMKTQIDSRHIQNKLHNLQLQETGSP